jgi:hypothetical protein
MGAEYQFVLFKMYIYHKFAALCHLALITDTLKINSQGMRVH